MVQIPDRIGQRAGGAEKGELIHPDSADVVIIGGGVSGLSSAYFLAKAGVDVVVAEKGIVGWEASSRNGGSMSPRADESPVIPMANKAREIWRTLDQELGYPTEFIHQGRLQVALRE
ncbi:MAG: NAD(P)/FAD-dependent oxidoreductase, partial [Dehalococcoidia bacterium]